MQAIIEAGGKQYTITEGQKFNVDRLNDALSVIYFIIAADRMPIVQAAMLTMVH